LDGEGRQIPMTDSRQPTGPGPVERTARSEYKNCAISVATEQTASGQWAVVATVLHSTASAITPTPVPLPDRTFESEAAAREFGIRRAQEWIDENAPRP
jgi:hypothetical protein